MNKIDEEFLRTRCRGKISKSIDLVESLAERLLNIIYIKRPRHRINWLIASNEGLYKITIEYMPNDEKRLMGHHFDEIFVRGEE